METASHRCARLLSALEELAAQEALLIGARDCAALRAVQERAAPLVEGLASVSAAADPAMRRRAVSLTKLRERNGELLAAEIERVRTELQIVEHSLQRVARVAPAYRHSPSPSVRRQLLAHG